MPRASAPPLLVGVALLVLVCAGACGSGSTGGGVDAAAIADREIGGDDRTVDSRPQADAPTPNDAGSDGIGDAGGDAVAADAGLTGCVEGSFDLYYGNLHAHTSFSDGEGTPAEAFAYARDTAGLDIMVVTDHLEQLYLGDRWGPCRAAADAADSPGSYVAMCGFEYGSGFSALPPASTGHNNVFFVDSLFPAIQLDFHDFYNTLVGCATCVGQFNHPGDSNALYWDGFSHDAAVDERITLFEFNSSEAWDLFFVALDQGWHVSPVYNQDNHGDDWGTKNDHRSGFWLTALSREAIRDAMLAQRTFATTDLNAQIALMAATSCWMGSRLSGLTQALLSVEVSDADATDGFARIELWGPGKIELASHDCGGTVGCTASFSVSVATPTYAFARAVQADGNFLVSAPIWLAP